MADRARVRVKGNRQRRVEESVIISYDERAARWHNVVLFDIMSANYTRQWTSHNWRKVQFSESTAL